MVKKYKTKKNLQSVWDELDNACGELDNALVDLHTLKGVPDEILVKASQIDFTQIVNLKNDVEALIDQKNKQ